MRAMAGMMLAMMLGNYQASQAAHVDVDQESPHIAAVPTKCPVKLISAKVVESAQGSIIGLSVQNTTTEDLTDLIFSVVQYSPDGRRAGSTVVPANASDLPIGAGKTQGVQLPPMFVDTEQLTRIGVSAIAPTSVECSDASVLEAADTEFEPRELVILSEDGLPVSLSDARIVKSDRGVPLRVTFVAKNVSEQKITGCKIAVFLFAYSEQRGTHLRESGEDGNLTTLSAMSSRSGEIQLRTPKDEKGPVKWKVVLGTIAAVVGQEPWHLQDVDQAARTALLSSFRSGAAPKN